MKGSLTNNIEEQNQLLKRRMKHLDELQISLEQKTAQIEYLQERCNSSKVDSEEIQLKEELWEAEYEKKVNEIKKDYERKETVLKEQYEQKIQDMKAANLLENEKMQAMMAADREAKEEELRNSEIRKSS